MGFKHKANNPALAEAVRIVGSAAKLARKLECTPGYLSRWWVAGVPAEYAIRIEDITNKLVTRHQLRPDLWPEPTSDTECAEELKRAKEYSSGLEVVLLCLLRKQPDSQITVTFDEVAQCDLTATPIEVDTKSIARVVRIGLKNTGSDIAFPDGKIEVA